VISEAGNQIWVRVALEPCDAFAMDLFNPDFFEEDSGDQKIFLKNYFLDPIGIEHKRILAAQM